MAGISKFNFSDEEIQLYQEYLNAKSRLENFLDNKGVGQEDDTVRKQLARDSDQYRQQLQDYQDSVMEEMLKTVFEKGIEGEDNVFFSDDESQDENGATAEDKMLEPEENKELKSPRIEDNRAESGFEESEDNEDVGDDDEEKFMEHLRLQKIEELMEKCKVEETLEDNEDKKEDLDEEEKVDSKEKEEDVKEKIENMGNKQESNKDLKLEFEANNLKGWLEEEADDGKVISRTANGEVKHNLSQNIPVLGENQDNYGLKETENMNELYKELEMKHSKELNKLKIQHAKTVARLKMKIEKFPKRKESPSKKEKVTCRVCLICDLPANGPGAKKHSFTKGGEIQLESCWKLQHMTTAEKIQTYQDKNICLRCCMAKRDQVGHGSQCRFTAYDRCGIEKCLNRYFACSRHAIHNIERFIKRNQASNQGKIEY